MKRTVLVLIALMIAAPLAAHAYVAPDLEHSPKLVRLKGTWFLRTPDKCVEVTLDRRGRSEILLGNRDIYIDRGTDYLFMTVKRYPHTYTYQMNPLEFGKNYVLELVAAGPEQPASDAPLSDRYTGVFRRMVDCQMHALAVEGGDSRTQPIEESNVGS